MLDDVTPCHTASISPDLVTLIKGSPQSAQSVGEQGFDRELPPSHTRPDWVHVALRQDGKRPVRTEAMLVWAYEDTLTVTFSGSPVAISHRLSIYIGHNRDVLAHLCYQPPQGYPARAVYRAFQPRTAQDLSESLRKNGPELCFEVSARTACFQDVAVPSPLVSSVLI